MSTPTSHTWRFYRAGGLDQVRIETGADIENLPSLDPKLWVALACPVKGLEFDEKTLALIDTDKDSRVRHAEILAAVQFLRERLRSLDSLLKGADSLPLADINDASPAGKAALASARRILANLGKPDAPAVAFDDIADPVKIFAGTKFNGDGVVPAESADDPDTAAVLKDILATQGATPDRSGLPGVDKPRIDAFFAELKALSAWTAKGEADPTVNPFGPDTPAALAAVKAVRAKVDDFFARCHLAAFDPRALAAVNRAETEYLAIAAKDLTVTAQEVAGFPLSLIEPGKALPLVEGVNPAWVAAITTLRTAAVAPAFGAKSSLSESEWRELNARLAPHEAWTAAKPAAKADSLGLPRALAILASGAEAKVADLLARDLALADESKGIDAVEKLVRLNRDFVRLLNNFVSFGDFYDPRRIPVFRIGRLFLDSRECHLCIRVEDAGKHAAMAGLSKCYLAYCEVTRKGGAEKMQILAVFSQGDSDYLMVGRNGIFVDRKGQDWDATITKIIDAPISIRQAFFAPYKKFVRMVEEQIAKRAAAADAESDAKLAATADKVANADKADPKAVAKSKFDPGTVAALGVAVGAIMGALGAIATKIIELSALQMALLPFGLILLISGPAMLIAAIKLRQRNLGPILDANGWAMNGRVKVNIPFGTSLTHAAELPAGSESSLDDPFSEKPSPWPKILVALAILVAAGWGVRRSGIADGFIRQHLGESWVYKSPDQLERERLDREAAEKAVRDAKAREAAEKAAATPAATPAK